MDDTTPPSPAIASKTPGRALVLAGGDMLRSPAETAWTYVVAADSGYDHAVEHGIRVDLLVGDLDSISSSGLEHARSHGVAIRQHPEDKDQTDLELALRSVIAMGYTDVTIHGGEGGRLSHLLSVALGLGDDQWSNADIEWHTLTGVVRTATANRPLRLDAAQGHTVSLLPIGPAEGVTTTGLRWKLSSATLPAGTTRGLSNEVTDTPVTVHVESGVLIVIEEGTVT